MSKIYKSDKFIFNKFSSWYESARGEYLSRRLDNFNAFCLSTSLDGIPSSRMVLLKSFSQEGFIFYTNSQSSKGIQMMKNNNVAMLFYWPVLSRQLRIQGTITTLPDELTEEYFKTRSYLSKIGAWASKQSQEMNSFMDILKNVAYYSSKYKIEVPKPDYWKGFLVSPDYVEFWREKPFRLHIRKSYKKVSSSNWQETILFP